MEFNNADTSRISVNDTKTLQSLIGTANISKDFASSCRNIWERISNNLLDSAEKKKSIFFYKCRAKLYIS